MMRMSSPRTAGASTRPSVSAAVCLTALALLAWPQRAAVAQVPVVAPPALGMGHAAYDGVACGPDALAGNPAALARSCRAPVRMILMPTLALDMVDNGAGSAIWGNRATIMEAFDRQAFGDGMDAATRDEILASIPEDGYRHRNRVILPVAQAGIGSNSALSLTFTAGTEGRISRDLVELMLRGYEEGRFDYSIGDTDQRTHGYWTLALGHGRSLMGLVDVGVTARVMSGTFLTRWQAFEPQVFVEEMEVRGGMVGAFAGDKLFGGGLFDIRPPDGFGFGLDVGAMRDIGPLRVGAAVHNLLHGMYWSEDIHLRTLTLVGTIDSTYMETGDDIFDPATASPEAARVAAALAENAGFPTRGRLSATLTPNRWVTLSSGAIFTLSDGELDRDWDQRFGVGAQLRPLSMLRLHAGMATDLGGSQELSGGIEVDLARTRLGAGMTRVSESDGMGGWRLSAGISRF